MNTLFSFFKKAALMFLASFSLSEACCLALVTSGAYPSVEIDYTNNNKLKLSQPTLHLASLTREP